MGEHAGQHTVRQYPRQIGGSIPGRCATTESSSSPLVGPISPSLRPLSPSLPPSLPPSAIALALSVESIALVAPYARSVPDSA
eukprot:952511-Rhodomonas_salina.1